MKQLLITTFIFFYLNVNSQSYSAARYKVDTAASNKAIRDLQSQMAALTSRVAALEAFQQAQVIKNTDFAAALKTLQIEDSLFFDTTSFIVVDHKYIFLKYPDLPQRVTALENWRTITQPMVDSLMAYMDKLKKTVFINPFPQ